MVEGQNNKAKRELTSMLHLFGDCLSTCLCATRYVGHFHTGLIPMVSDTGAFFKGDGVVEAVLDIDFDAPDDRSV